MKRKKSTVYSNKRVYAAQFIILHLDDFIAVLNSILQIVEHFVFIGSSFFQKRKKKLEKDFPNKIYNCNFNCIDRKAAKYNN